MAGRVTARRDRSWCCLHSCTRSHSPRWAAISTSVAEESNGARRSCVILTVIGSTRHRLLGVIGLGGVGSGPCGGGGGGGGARGSPPERLSSTVRYTITQEAELVLYRGSLSHLSERTPFRSATRSGLGQRLALTAITRLVENTHRQRGAGRSGKRRQHAVRKHIRRRLVEI